MRERGDEDGRGIIAVAERSGIEPWRDQFYNEHSDTLEVVKLVFKLVSNKILFCGSNFDRITLVMAVEHRSVCMSEHVVIVAV
jgi:hypothetical protein